MRLNRQMNSEPTYAAIIRPEFRSLALRWLLALLFLVIVPPATAQKSPDKESSQARLAKAEAMFKERCKTAGEKIFRTVENVEGIFLMKLRPTRNFSNQYALDDPYGRDLAGEGYIESFLRGEYQATHKGTTVTGLPASIGYLFVEAIDPKDGKRYRYSGSIKDVKHVSSILMGGDGKTAFVTKEFVLDKIPASGDSPRYGVTYDDISTREEREYWIAGSSLRVVDLKTNKVMAERIGYMMDLGQGERGGGRSPWLLAADNACPEFAPRHGATVQPYQTLNFVEKVLKPKREH